MKITFLGTSHAVNQKHRRCTSNLIEVNKTYYLLDAGASINDLLCDRNIPINKLKHIFTTHIHGDHIDGLFSYINLFYWHFNEDETNIYITDHKFIDLLLCYLETTHAKKIDFPFNRIKFTIVDEDFVYEDDNIKVKAIETKHMENTRTYAYLIEDKKKHKKVLFTGDLSWDLKESDFPDVECDYMICELAHINFDELKPYLDKFKGKAIYFNHVCGDEKFKQIKKLQKKYDYELVIPNDDDVLKI